LGKLAWKSKAHWIALHCVQAIIYVVDSSDTERIGTSADEFHAILDEEELKDALILVYANKQA
jgi:ADP-ribosylation factor-like protein 1